MSSYTFTSFNWLHDMFYKNINNKFVKIIPLDLENYLSPLALAIWFMDDGSKIHNTVRISTNNFNYNECVFLSKIFKK